MSFFTSIRIMSDCCQYSRSQESFLSSNCSINSSEDLTAGGAPPSTRSSSVVPPSALSMLAQAPEPHNASHLRRNITNHHFNNNNSSSSRNHDLFSNNRNNNTDNNNPFKVHNIASPTIRNNNINSSHLFGLSKFGMNKSILGDSLNTSLGGLQIGAVDSPFSSPAGAGGGSNSRFLLQQEHASDINSKRNGMTLRSATSSRLLQNTNGIAQSSWVAGGYWGSPTKGSRSPPTNNINNVIKPRGQQQQRQAAAAVPHDVFPISRSSSQSSGFVSHVSGSQGTADQPQNYARNITDSRANFDTDRISVNSEPGFVWNYESCETASQSSQNLDDIDPRVRRRLGRAETSSCSTYDATSDIRSLRSAATTNTTVHPPSSQYSSAVASSMRLSPQQHLLHRPASRDPYSDMQTMRALSRLSQHDISDDDLSMLSQRSTIEVVTKPPPTGSTSRNLWVAFILGMSVMANGFLALVLYKNGTFAELFK